MSPATPEDDVPAWGFIAWLHELIDARDPVLRPLGEMTRAASVMRGIADDTRESVWNMQRSSPARDLVAMMADVDEAARRGITTRPLYSRGALARSPLLSSAIPGIRVGPVTDPFMVVDRRVVVVNDAHGTTIWACEDPDVVARGVATFEAEWAAATPAVAPGAPPPYTRRMTEVGAHLATGRTDREIAQAVGISERSVSAGVRELSRRLGASGRGHAIARINGAA